MVGVGAAIGLLGAGLLLRHLFCAIFVANTTATTVPVLALVVGCVAAVVTNQALFRIAPGWEIDQEEATRMPDLDGDGSQTALERACFALGCVITLAAGGQACLRLGSTA